MKPEDLVEFAEGLARIAASGGGTKALVAHLARITRCGVMLEDAQWRALVTAGSDAMPKSARSVVEEQSPGLAARVLNGQTHLGWLSLFGETVHWRGTRFEVAPTGAMSQV